MQTLPGFADSFIVLTACIRTRAGTKRKGEVADARSGLQQLIHALAPCPKLPLQIFVSPREIIQTPLGLERVSSLVLRLGCTAFQGLHLFLLRCTELLHLAIEEGTAGHQGVIVEQALRLTLCFQCADLSVTGL